MQVNSSLFTLRSSLKYYSSVIEILGRMSEELYHLLGSLHVEIEEELVFLFKEGADVVLIILEEWTLAIGGEERIPVDMAPVAWSEMRISFIASDVLWFVGW
mgnify:CR=1 FL=1